MAATVAASKAYDLSGGALKEDLTDVIYDISPMDTIFLTRAARGTAKSTTHEWLTDTLVAASATNAAIEGDAFAAVARTLPSRLKNYTQISRKEFEVTGTAQKVDNAGMRELLAYHTARAAKELKRDIEAAMLQNNPATAGSSVSARVSASVENWIYTTNHISATGQTANTTPAPASGFASGAVVDGTAAAYTRAALNSGLSQAWSCGGETDTILVGATLYNTIGDFSSIATRFRDVASRQQAQIIGAADVYVSPYGSHNIVLSRYSRTDVVLGLEMKSWEVAYLRPFQTIEISKIGDGERRMLLAEWTLVAKTPKANFKTTEVS
jgi:hypothetical protein